MGSFNAAHHRVAHAEEEASEGPGVYITVTLRTDVFHTGQSGAEQATNTEYIYDAFLRYQFSAVVARFVANRPPRIPTLRDAIESIVGSFETGRPCQNQNIAVSYESLHDVLCNII